MYGCTLRSNVIDNESWSKDSEIQVLYWAIFSLGITLGISSILSYVGMIIKKLSFFLYLALALIVPLLFGVVFCSLFIIFEGDDIETWITSHQDSLNLTDAEINGIKTWTTWTQFLLLALFINELLRVMMFRKILKSLKNQNGALTTHELNRELEEAADSLATKLLVEEKYSDLRQVYRDKYSFDGVSGFENNESDTTPLVIDI